MGKIFQILCKFPSASQISEKKISRISLSEFNNTFFKSVSDSGCASIICFALIFAVSELTFVIRLKKFCFNRFKLALLLFESFSNLSVSKFCSDRPDVKPAHLACLNFQPFITATHSNSDTLSKNKDELKLFEREFLAFYNC